jgi:hypothetical protein
MFGPDNRSRALDEATRLDLGIDQPTINGLDATAQTENLGGANRSRP